MADTQLFINGEWTAPQSGETFPTFAPSTGEKIADVAKAGRDDAQRAIQAARDAFEAWASPFNRVASALAWALSAAAPSKPPAVAPAYCSISFDHIASANGSSQVNT